MEDIFYQISHYIDIISFCIISYGAVVAIIGFIKFEYHRIRGKFTILELNSVQLELGHYILLGLQFLIVADIITTILKPTQHELFELGGIVIIRIFLSFFLNREISNLKKEVNKDKSITG